MFHIIEGESVFAETKKRYIANGFTKLATIERVVSSRNKYILKLTFIKDKQIKYMKLKDFVNQYTYKKHYWCVVQNGNKIFRFIGYNKNTTKFIKLRPGCGSLFLYSLFGGRFYNKEVNNYNNVPLEILDFG